VKGLDIGTKNKYYNILKINALTFFLALCFDIEINVFLQLLNTYTMQNLKNHKNLINSPLRRWQWKHPQRNVCSAGRLTGAILLIPKYIHYD